VEKSWRLRDESRANRFMVHLRCFGNFGALCDRVKTSLTALAVFTLVSTAAPHLGGTTRAAMCLPLRCDRTHHMTIYRITKRDARFIVGTEQEAVLICRSLEVAHQAVADAELLETIPAKLIFARRVKDEREAS
jgi:hypothetical protein